MGSLLRIFTSFDGGINRDALILQPEPRPAPPERPRKGRPPTPGDVLFHPWEVRLIPKAGGTLPVQRNMATGKFQHQKHHQKNTGGKDLKGRINQ